MVRTKKAIRPFRAYPFYHCASVPPAGRAGIVSQAVRTFFQGSAADGPGIYAGRSGRIIHPFSGVVSSNYWSSTSNANNPDNAWIVNLNNGNDNNNDKSNHNYVWPVRGGE